MKFSITDFFSKCDQIQRKVRIWSHSQKKSVMENFIFCNVALNQLVRMKKYKFRLIEKKNLHEEARKYPILYDKSLKGYIWLYGSLCRKVSQNQHCLLPSSCFFQFFVVFPPKKTL